MFWQKISLALMFCHFRILRLLCEHSLLEAALNSMVNIALVLVMFFQSYLTVLSLGFHGHHRFLELFVPVFEPLQYVGDVGG